MVLDISLLNTQHYKVCIKGKVKQSSEKSSALPSLHLGVVAIEMGAFESPSTTVANFTYLLYLYIFYDIYIYIYMYIYTYIYKFGNWIIFTDHCFPSQLHTPNLLNRDA